MPSTMPTFRLTELESSDNPEALLDSSIKVPSGLMIAGMAGVFVFVAAGFVYQVRKMLRAKEVGDE